LKGNKLPLNALSIAYSINPFALALYVNYNF